MSPNFITLSDLKNYVELSDNIDATKKINTYMWEAEDIDLQNAVGQIFYQDWMLHKADGSGIYFDLLNGKTYTPIGLTTPVIYRGAKPMIAYYAYARILPHQGVDSTPWGLTGKNSGFSQPSPDKTIARLIEQALQKAKKYENAMIQFLNEQYTYYPVWQQWGIAYQGSRSGSSYGITAAGTINEDALDQVFPTTRSKFDCVR